MEFHKDDNYGCSHVFSPVECETETVLFKKHEKKSSVFAEISHRVTKLIQISMPSRLDCYESIYFLLLCTTGKISVSRGGEIKRFHPFWKPAPHKTEENHHWKYCNNFFPSGIAVTSMLLSYWYHSQHLTDTSCYRQRYIFPQRFNFFTDFIERNCMLI